MKIENQITLFDYCFNLLLYFNIWHNFRLTEDSIGHLSLEFIIFKLIVLILITITSLVHKCQTIFKNLGEKLRRYDNFFGPQMSNNI